MTSGASLETRLFAFFSQPNYEPMKRHEIARALELDSVERRELRALLNRLEREGRVVCLRKNRWSLPDADRFIPARLSVLPSGDAVATAEGEPTREYFVSRAMLAGALHGDKVLLELLRRRIVPGDPRVPARVVRVTERATCRVPGLLMRGKFYWYVIPDHPRIHENIHVTGAAEGIRLVEQRHVVVELEPWSGAGAGLRGEVVEDLGADGAEGLRFRILLRNYQLDERFEQEVEREARSRPPALTASDLADREDLRGLVTFTIDPADARDFDDAVSLQKVPEGWLLGVHIADVSHFVPIGSEVDREAARRGNSVYLTGGFVPMLPKYLTSDVCSLKAGEDRLTYTVWLTLDSEGNVLKRRFVPSVIHSRARLDYDQVQRHFDNPFASTIPAEVRGMLDDMRALAALLRRRRMANGALDLTMPEIICELDVEGRPIAIRRRGAMEAYHLIEEFMLLANVAVAERLAEQGVPAIYRIHEAPSPEQWEALAEALDQIGIHRTVRNKHQINRLCADVAGTPREYIVNLTILRHMKRAMYAEKLAEHYGLGFECYTHFTSPIRRYPDLIVHRLLKAVEQHKRPPYRQAELRRIAEHCSDTERNADEAEQESLKQACLRYYADRLAEGEVGPYKGVITGIVTRGVIVELYESLARGLLLLDEIGPVGWVADPARGEVKNRRSRQTLHIGDPIEVELLRVDERRQRIDFTLARSNETAANVPRQEPASNRRRNRQRIR